jgi:hypothetical protein
MNEYPRCMVRGCFASSAGAQWLTNPTPNWTVGWTVCREHFWLLHAGEEFAQKADQWPSNQRWLLMGDDLVIAGGTRAVSV